MHLHIRDADAVKLGTGSSRSAGAHRGAGHAGLGRGLLRAGHGGQRTPYRSGGRRANPAPRQRTGIPTDGATKHHHESHHQHRHQHHQRQSSRITTSNHLPYRIYRRTPTTRCGDGHSRAQYRGFHLAPGHRLLPGRARSLVRPSRPRPSYFSLANIHMLVRISGRDYSLALISTKLFPSGPTHIAWSGFHARTS